MRPAFIALWLLLAGCANHPDHPHVRIAMVGIGLQTQQTPVSLASTLGFFKDEGLDVSIVNFSSNTKTLESLLGGSVDVADISYQQNIQMASQGQRVRAFFIAVQRCNIVLLVAPKASAKIRRVEDLKGAVIGIPSPGSPTHQWVNHVLAAHGVRPTEVSAVGIGVAASAVAALESGRIDAAGLSGGDHIRLLRRNPSLRILLDGTTPEGMRETFGGNLYGSGAVSAKQDWLDRNPGTARRLGRALLRALQWINTHTPEEILKHLPDSSRSQDEAADLDILRWSLPAFTADGKMPKGAPEAMKRFLDATIDQVRDSKIDLAATWTDDFLPGPK